MKYRRYLEEDDIHLAALRDEIKEALHASTCPATDHSECQRAVQDDRRAGGVMALFRRVKVHTWCGRPDCHQSWCTPTHYAFDVTTHGREFEDAEQETDLISCREAGES